MREKLIELLDGWDCPILLAVCEAESLVDYLIENGVTVQKKGKWVWKDFPKADGTVERKAVCSLCDVPNKQYTPPYCPHCGADMRGAT